MEMDSHPLVENQGFISRLRRSLWYAYLADEQGESSAVLTAALLDNMEHSITRMLARGQVEMADPSLASGMFRQLVLKAGVSHYVRRKLVMNPSFFKGPYADWISSPLRVVLHPVCNVSAEDRYWILQRLLQSGFDPNQRHFPDPKEPYMLQSSWENLFFEDSSLEKPWFLRVRAFVKNKVLLAMVEHGADLSIVASLRCRGYAYDMPIWLVLLLAAISDVYSWKCAKAYEETLDAIFKRARFLKDLSMYMLHPGEDGGNVTDADATLIPYRLWYLLDRLSLSAMDAKQDNGQFLVRIFACLLSKIPPEFEAFKAVKELASVILSDDAASKLTDAVASMQSNTLSKKRRLDDEQVVSAKKKKRLAKAPCRKPKDRQPTDSGAGLDDTS